jgi:hypothetical protein
MLSEPAFAESSQGALKRTLPSRGAGSANGMPCQSFARTSPYGVAWSCYSTDRRRGNSVVALDGLRELLMFGPSRRRCSVNRASRFSSMYSCPS